MEEEWPSLGLDVELKEEVVEDEEEEEVEEPEVSEVEEEWPSINSISGLELSQQQSSPQNLEMKSASSTVVQDDSDSSSLGELRFQDE